MKILVTGRGTSGSWQIRGVQLGQALGAAVVPRATDVSEYNVAIVVKRATPEILAPLHKANVPIVWDVVDAWPQPDGNLWGRAELMAWFRQQVAAIRPVALVAATLQMAEDIGGFDIPVLALPHHARPNIAVNPVRETVQTVGYEGAEHYLGYWRVALETECARRGWRFVVNPPKVADLDIVVAMREWAGYGPTRWKSNVKLANAQGSGTPFIGSRESGYLEGSVKGRERFATTHTELSDALDSLTPYDERLRVSQAFLKVAPRIEKTAGVYSSWLRTICVMAPSC